ncbi:putative retrotransposon protein [Tanacetum coccineum]|uniref:Retrotransposon protein n=1 Tax=Tanacetum coccineum TaxID=301880 RepID=A0ABQ5I640_9ASTR
MCLYIDSEEHELGDLNEPTNYKAALLDHDSDKWLAAMNAKMQSMKDNRVWDLVNLPPNGKIVSSKWLFKKKTEMDGNVHTYKARLVANGFTQTYKVDCQETFSSVVDIRATRILIAIAAYYDYEIWKMDVKTAFLNGHLSEEVYMAQPKGASTPVEVKHMQRVPYASANLGELHWTAVKNILKYLRNTKDMFLVYGGDIKREFRVSCYTDAGYLTNVDDYKSQTSYVFILNRGAVDWKSTKQSIFATPSAESKYIVALNASKEAVWIRKFIFGLGVVPINEEPMKMYCDNIGAISIANEPAITNGARHYRAKVHYLREMIEFGDIKLVKVHTDDNVADPFTKALLFNKHYEYTKNIGIYSDNEVLLDTSIVTIKPNVLLQLLIGSCWNLVVGYAFYTTRNYVSLSGAHTLIHEDIACTSTAYNELTEHYPVTTKILKMTTLAEHMIMAGAENRPPMLDKTMYNSWQSRMLIYIKGKKNGRMMLESIENGPLVYLAIEENGTAKDIDERVKLLMQGVELPYQERECKLYNEFDRTYSNLRNQATIQDGRVTFQQIQRRQGQRFAGMGIKGNATRSVGNNATGQAQKSGQVLDEEQLAFLADAGIANVQDTQTTITHNAAFQTDDLL